MQGSRNQGVDTFFIIQMTHVEMLHALSLQLWDPQGWGLWLLKGCTLARALANAPLSYACCQGTLGSLCPGTMAKEGSHVLKGQVTSISRKTQTCFYTKVAGKNTHRIQVLWTECVPTKFIC